MMHLIVTLDDKNVLASMEDSGGIWKIYLETSGQKTKVEEKFFGHENIEHALVEAIQSLIKRNRNH